jgi:hypothetical protein
MNNIRKINSDKLFDIQYIEPPVAEGAEGAEGTEGRDGGSGKLFPPGMNALADGFIFFVFLGQFKM